MRNNSTASASLTLMKLRYVDISDTLFSDEVMSLLELKDIITLIGSDTVSACDDNIPHVKLKIKSTIRRISNSVLYLSERSLGFCHRTNISVDTSKVTVLCAKFGAN